MSVPPSDSSERHTDSARDRRRGLDRLLFAGALLSLAGVGLAGLVLYVHARLAATAGYTSFCNVSSTINCDEVIGSPFASLLGVPLGWFALAAYASLGALFVAAMRARDRIAGTLVRAACLSVFAAAAFSLYMAYISFVVIGAVCLMCSGLYVVAAALAVVAWFLPRRFVEGTGGAALPLSRGGSLASLGACLLAVVVLARATWPPGDSSACRMLDPETIRVQEPDFYRWYSDLPVEDPPLVERHALGDPDAPVTIVEFFDFECGYCRANHQELKDLLERRRGEVRVIYRHFPLDASCNEALDESIHTRACRAAEAAECAALQGRFADMADAMFIRQRQLFETNLPRIAERLGLDMDEFERCMSDHETLPLVLEDTRAGQRLELRSTPTLFINGRRIVGSISEPCGYDYALAIEEAALASRTSP